MDTVERRMGLVTIALVSALGAILVAWMIVDARRDNAFEIQESTTRSGGPAAKGSEKLIAGAYLEASHSGTDRVELVRADLIRLTGDGAIEMYVIDTGRDGGIGAVTREAVMADGRTFGEILQPLNGFTFTPGASDIEVVVGVTPTSDSTTRWDAVRVDYVFDGKPGSQVYGNGGTVCVHDPPEPCPDDEER